MYKTSSVAAAAFAVASLSNAASYIPLNYPGATTTSLLRINHFGQILGVYSLPGPQNVHSFIYTYPTGVFTSIPDYPGAIGTEANGMNDDGLVVGHWFGAGSTSGNFFYDLNTGRFSPYPAAGTPLDVNNKGETTGSTPTGQAYYALGASLGPLRFPGSSSTAGYGITGSATTATRIVGTYLDSTASVNGNHGFLWVIGGFLRIDFPGALNTYAQGIYAQVTNTSIRVVGAWLENAGAFGVLHGFLYSYPSTFTLIDPPGATWSGATGINDAGMIVGSFTTAPGPIPDLPGPTQGYIRVP